MAVDVVGSEASQQPEGEEEFKVRCACGCNVVAVCTVLLRLVTNSQQPVIKLFTVFIEKLLKLWSVGGQHKNRFYWSRQSFIGWNFTVLPNHVYLKTLLALELLDTFRSHIGN